VARLVITIWDVWDSAMKTREFNHISTGYDGDVMEPAPGSEGQRKAWAQRVWAPRPALLNEGVVVETLAPFDIQRSDEQSIDG
jgi:hypothetical protein